MVSTSKRNEHPHFDSPPLLDDYVAKSRLENYKIVIESMKRTIQSKDEDQRGVENQRKALNEYKNSYKKGVDDNSFHNGGVLVVHGREDLIIPPSCGYRLALDYSQSDYIELGNVGHLILLEAGQKFATHVSNFLK